MASIIKNSIVVILLLLTVGFGYFLYTQNQLQMLQASDNSISLDAAAEAATFLAQLNELKGMTLSNEIFLDPRFNAFVDYAGEIQPVDFGKANPFAN